MTPGWLWRAWLTLAVISCFQSMIVSVGHMADEWCGESHCSSRHICCTTTWLIMVSYTVEDKVFSLLAHCLPTGVIQSGWHKAHAKESFEVPQEFGSVLVMSLLSNLESVPYTWIQLNEGEVLEHEVVTVTLDLLLCLTASAFAQSRQRQSGLAIGR